MTTRTPATWRSRALLIVVPIIILIIALAVAGFVLEIVARAVAGVVMIVLVLAAIGVVVHLARSWQRKHGHGPVQ